MTSQLMVHVDPANDFTSQNRDDDDSQNKRSKFTNNNSRQGNIKSKFDQLEESNDHDDIRRQVEFYFSDSNLPIDKYLLGLVGVQENKPVDLKIIHSFKRMQRYQPFSAVRDAVKASDFLDLNENDEVSRKKPLSDKYTDDVYHNKQLLHDSSLYRSIYAKGFGEETKDTHINIENFFRLYTDFKSLRLRRDQDGYFKGSVFVEFESEDAANDFLGLENKPEFEGKELTIMSKQKYVDDKNQGILDGTVRPRSPLGYNSRAGRGRGRGRGGNDRNGRGRDRDGRGRGDRRGGDRRGRDDYGRDEGRRARSPNRRGRGGKNYKRDRSGSRDARGVYKGDLDDWKKRREHDNRDDGDKAEKDESKAEEAKSGESKGEEVKADGGKDVSVEA